MKKVVIALLLIVVGVAAASAFGLGPKGSGKFGIKSRHIAEPNINESNFEDVKAKILNLLEDRISRLTEFKSEVESANTPEELQSVLESHSLEDTHSCWEMSGRHGFGNCEDEEDTHSCWEMSGRHGFGNCEDE